MDDTTPATKGDLHQLRQEMQGGFKRIEQRMDERFNNMHEDIDRVLSILVKNKETVDDHEKRIVRLEKVVA